MNIIKFNKQKRNNNQIVEKNFVAKELETNYIAVNCDYKLYYLPYYSNSPYYYEDFYSEKGFNNLLSNGITLKPVNNNPRINVSRYFNVNNSPGELITKIVIPRYNNQPDIKINRSFIIKKIYTYGYKPDMLKKYLYIITRKNIWDTNVESELEIEFICFKEIENSLFNIYEWIPTSEIEIKIEKYFEIKIEEFGDNFEIYYK